jgi:hypothetical protein
MFNNYPNIQYRIDENDIPHIIKNYFYSLEFYYEYLNKNMSFFKKYRIIDGETPESISLKFYNSYKYWFLILLLNQKQDPFFDWILTNDELITYATKYVITNPLDVSEYVSNHSEILVNFNEEYMTNFNSYLDISDPTNTQDPLVQLMIDKYYTEMERENDIKRDIWLPDETIMKKIYNDFMKKTNGY